MADIRIEVVHALPERQVLLSLVVPEGTTVTQAVSLSGIAGQLPGVELARCAVGVFGKVVEGGHRLRDGDRVELYRPLLVDPKEVRRQRAEKAAQQARRRKTGAKP